MNRMAFIAPPKKPKAPKQPKTSKTEASKEKPLSGYMYVAMGYLPGEHEYRSYKSATVSHRSGNQRKNRNLSIRPLQYKDKASVIRALNEMIDFVQANDEERSAIVNLTHE